MAEVTTTDASSGGVTETSFEYDATGIRVASTHKIDGTGDGTFESQVRTEVLVDHDNFTGYQQAIKETHTDLLTGNVTKTIEYTYGHDEIAQTVTEFDATGNPTSEATHIFGHDGHGSVRVLYNASAAVLQLYSYNAYGEMLGIHNDQGAFVSADEAAALTILLYSGEPYYQQIAMQYLRARFYDSARGRFNRLDPFAGNIQDPQSLQKYGYVHDDPVNYADPSGEVIGGSGLSALIGIGNMIQARAKHSRAVFAQGGAAIGNFFRSLGLYTQNLAFATLRSIPGLAILQNQAVGRRFIDFIVRSGNRIMMIEVKYGIPQRAGPALDRLAGQMTAMVQSNAGQAVVWSLRAPSVAQLNRVQNAVGPHVYNNTQFAEGVFGLIQVVRLYFGL